MTDQTHLIPDRKYLRISGTAAFVFLLMTAAMFYPPVKRLSGELTLKVMYVRPVIWTEIMFFITYLGSAWVLTGLTITTAAMLAAIKNKRDALYVLVTMALVPLVLILTKALLSQNPPTSISATSELNAMLTYPSDYAFGAASYFTAVGIVALGFLSSVRARILTIGGLGLVILLIGTSRVFHGRNYPADIVAALSLGVAWASFMRYEIDYLSAKRKR